MKGMVGLCAVVLVVLLLAASVVGCQQPETGPSVTIMAESSIVEAGSSFVVSGLHFKPGQKVWVDFEWQASDRGEGVTAYCEADENGSIHPVIDVPEDAIPGDYEIEVFTGNSVHDRELFATLPIRIQAREDTFTVVLELSAQKTTLAEASSIMGVTVPVPTYLPEGYEVQEIYVEGSAVARLLISDRETEKKLVTHTDAAGTRQRYELRCRMTMYIRWCSKGQMGGLKLPGSRVTIGETRGVIEDWETYNTLWWLWPHSTSQEQPGQFEIALSANKGISKWELVKIAESVQY